MFRPFQEKRGITSIQCKAVSTVMVLLLSIPAVAADADAVPSAMAHSYGRVWLNGLAAPSHSPLFPGDKLQTDLNSTANISAPNLSLTIQPGSLADFEPHTLVLETGAANISTAARMSARAGDVEIVPVSNAWTNFKVTHLNGQIQIIALKGDLQLDDGQQTDTLHEGQQATEDESQGTTTQKPHRPTRGKFIKKKYVIYAAIAGGTAAGIWAIVDATSGSSSVSPTTP